MRAENNGLINNEYSLTTNEIMVVQDKITQFKKWFGKHRHLISHHKRPVIDTIIEYTLSPKFFTGKSHLERYILVEKITDAIKLSDVLFFNKTLNLLNKADYEHVEQQKKLAKAARPQATFTPGFSACTLSMKLRPIIKNQQKIILQETTKPFIIILSACILRDALFETHENNMIILPFYAMLLLAAVAMTFAYERSFKKLPTPIDITHRFVTTFTPFCEAPNDKRTMFAERNQANNKHLHRN